MTALLRTGLKLLLKVTTPRSPPSPEPHCPACTLGSLQAIPELQPGLVPRDILDETEKAQVTLTGIGRGYGSGLQTRQMHCRLLFCLSIGGWRYKKRKRSFASSARTSLAFLNCNFSVRCCSTAERLHAKNFHALLHKNELQIRLSDLSSYRDLHLRTQ